MNIITGKEVTEGIYKGTKPVIDAVRISFGPRGLNADVESEFYPFHDITNDCETIIQATQSDEKDSPLEKKGLIILKELSSKADKDSGNGRKTTLLIYDKIMELGLKSELTGMELKRELDSLIPLIESKIDDETEQITEDKVEAVATIASESQELGKLLGEIYQRIGKDGIIIPEGSSTYTTSYSIIEGIRFNGTGYLSPYLVFDENTEKPTKAIYENPFILVTKNKITKDSEIDPLVQKSIDTGRPLVIFTDDMDSGVAQRLIATHKAKVAKILIIKAPVLWKNYVFEDFAKVTGSTIIEDTSGINFKNIKITDLGTCAKITVDKDETIILGGQDITEHINLLRQNDDNDSKLRLSWLQTKTCLLKLGANNESELSLKRRKCYDAINSSQKALKYGVVKGGGESLFDVAQTLPKDNEICLILSEALKEPLRQNMVNMNIETFFGFDINIIDSAIITKNSVRNAIALASTILTLGINTSLPVKNAQQLANEALSQKGLRF